MCHCNPRVFHLKAVLIKCKNAKATLTFFNLNLLKTLKPVKQEMFFSYFKKRFRINFLLKKQIASDFLRFRVGFTARYPTRLEPPLNSSQIPPPHSEPFSKEWLDHDECDIELDTVCGIAASKIE